MSAVKWNFKESQELKRMGFVRDAALASGKIDHIRHLVLEKTLPQTLRMPASADDISNVLAQAHEANLVLVTNGNTIDPNTPAPKVTLPKKGGYFKCEVVLGDVIGKGSELEAVDFCGASAKAYHLRDAQLQMVSFTGRSLTKDSDFTGANLTHCFFIAAKFGNGFDLSQAKIDDKTLFIASNWGQLSNVSGGIKTLEELASAIKDGIFSNHEMQLCRNHLGYALDYCTLESLQKDDINAAIAMLDTKLVGLAK